MSDCATASPVRYTAVDYSALPYWERDDHLAAFATFIKSCRHAFAGSSASDPALRLAPVRSAALAAEALVSTAAQARHFFEYHFQPQEVAHSGPTGFLTGYYEPLIDGSRVADEHFNVPLHRRPPDLVNLVDDARRGAVAEQLTHARLTTAGPVPYATRAEIEEGALQGQGLELLYLADPVDAFLLHVQGSGQIRLPDGALVRVSYDGKNGHPYTSIGRHLIETGAIDAASMSLQTLADWLKADRTRGEAVMRRNRSYVFFRELTGAQSLQPLGVHDVPLTPGRSMAVDTTHHLLGLPIYVCAPTLTHAGAPDGLRRLMIAQDVGSAIRGPERGDLFFGSGDEAAGIAGITKHPGIFFVLHPRVDRLSDTYSPLVAPR